MSRAKGRQNAGFARYFRIIALLHQHPEGLLTSQVYTITGNHRNKALELLGDLRSLRLVRRVQVNPQIRSTSFLWFLGEDSDLRTLRGHVVQPRPQAIQFAALMRALKRPVSVAQIAHDMGVLKCVASRHVQAGRDAWGLFPVVGFVPCPNRPPTPLYQFAPGQPDAIYTPKTKQQINADYRERKRKERERAERLRLRAANSSIFRLAQAA